MLGRKGGYIFGPRRQYSIKFDIFIFVCVAGLTLARPQFAKGEEFKGTETLQVTAPVNDDLDHAAEKLTTTDLRRFDLHRLEDLPALVDGLAVTRAANGSGGGLALRGIGSVVTSVGIAAPVSVLVDDFSVPSTNILREAFFDPALVEVLKGPSPIRGGRNGTAGTIVIRSAEPTADFISAVSGGYEWGAREPMGEAVVAGPLSDHWGLRLAVRGSATFGGAGRNVATAQTYTTIDSVTYRFTPHAVAAARDAGASDGSVAQARLNVSWKPQGTFTAAFKLGGGDLSSGDPAGNYALWKCPSGHSALKPDEICGDFRHVQHNPVPRDLSGANTYLGLNGGAPSAREQTIHARLTLDWSPNLAHVALVSAFEQGRNRSVGDFDFSGAAAIWAGERIDLRSFGQAIAIRRNILAGLSAELGADWREDDRDLATAAAFAGADNSLAAPADRYLGYSRASRTRARSVSEYLSLSWRISDALDLQAGGRSIEDSSRSFAVFPYVNPFLSPIFSAGKVLAADQRFSRTSPEAQLTWAPADGITAHIAYRAGYKSGGFSNNTVIGLASTANDAAFRPETARGLDVGVEGAFMADRLRLSMDGFDDRHDHLQVDYLDPSTFSYVTTNAGSARTRGVELTADWRADGPSSRHVRAGLLYDEARYVQFAAPCFLGQSREEGCGPSPPGSPLGLRQDLTGRPLPNAPRWTASLLMDQEWRVADRLSLGAALNSRWQSARLVSPFAMPLDRQGATGVLDAAVWLAGPDDKWELRLFGQNLTNQTIVAYALDAPQTGFGTGTSRAVHADQVALTTMPRRLGLVGRLAF